jgi:hypothetical protein
MTNPKKLWERILGEVEKREVPVEVLESVVVQFIDGSTIEIDIRELLSEGQDPKTIEQSLNEKIDVLESLIENVDFYIDIDLLSKTVQVETDQILKNL